MSERESRLKGALVGLAVGDAVGTTNEFMAPGAFEPLTDMVGGGPFSLEPGEWTDDTAMALCLAESLVECDGFDATDQARRYLRWYREGHLSCTGNCFDIGNTVRQALERFEALGDPLAGARGPRSAGNGSIMRLAPVPMRYHADRASALHLARQSSRTTHGAPECLDACELMAGMLLRAFEGCDKDEMLFGSDPVAYEAPRIAALARGEWRDKRRDEIRGSGYVVESLEAAAWCFWQTDNFRDAVLVAANLGHDADTTAAVCGQLAGAHYGVEGIPGEWRQRLAMRATIEDLAERLISP